MSVHCLHCALARDYFNLISCQFFCEAATWQGFKYWDNEAKTAASRALMALLRLYWLLMAGAFSQEDKRFRREQAVWALGISN